MGYTKIWTISTRLDHSLDYITNPDKTKYKLDIEAVEGPEKYITNKDKTESALYIDAFNCSKQNAVKHPRRRKSSSVRRTGKSFTRQTIPLSCLMHLFWLSREKDSLSLHRAPRATMRLLRRSLSKQSESRILI